MNRFIMTACLGLLSTSQLIAAPDLTNAATDACKRLEAPYAQTTIAMDAIKKAQQSGDMAKLLKLQQQMMAVLQASTGCFEALSKKYPEIDQDDELKKQVTNLTQQMCPNPMTGS